MQIILNGDPHPIEKGQTVADLLKQAGWQERRLAVERNGDIVPRSQHASTELQDNDRIEVVMAVGGG